MRPFILIKGEGATSNGGPDGKKIRRSLVK